MWRAPTHAEARISRRYRPRLAASAKTVSQTYGVLCRAPEFVEQCVDLVKIVDVNPATLPMFGAASKDELLASLTRIVRPETRPIFVENSWRSQGERHYEDETRTSDPRRTRRWRRRPRCVSRRKSPPIETSVSTTSPLVFAKAAQPDYAKRSSQRARTQAPPPKRVHSRSRLLGSAPAPDRLEKRFLTPMLPSQHFIAFPAPAIPATGDRAIPAPRCKAGSRPARSWRSTRCSEVTLLRQKAPGLSRTSLA